MKALSELTEREVARPGDRQRGGGFADLPELRGSSAPGFRRLRRRSSTTWPRRSATTATPSTTLYRSRFGEHLPPIRREDVRGFLKRRTVWWSPNLDLDRMRREAELMELQAANFYDRAAAQATGRLGARAVRRSSPRWSAGTSAKPTSSPKPI